jgi:hypothetical protein
MGDELETNSQRASRIPYEGPISLREVILVLRGWRAADTYPWMRRKAMNWLVPRAGWGMCLGLVALHFAWAGISSCSADFARAGAAVTLVAAIGAALLDWHDPKAMALDGGKLPIFRLLNPIVALALQVALGTIIWGYGDLLPILSRTGCT